MKQVHVKTSSFKVWLLIVTVLLGIMVLLSLTLVNTTPNVRTLPQFFTKDTMFFERYLEIENLNQEKIKEKKLIDDMLIRFYLENRNEYMPDKTEMTYRWSGRGPVARLSSDNVYRDFWKVKSKELEGIGDADMLSGEKENMDTKSIDIISISRIDNVFTVDFDTYQRRSVSAKNLGRKRAIIEIKYNPRSRYRFASDFANPYGLTVTSYKESEKKY